LVLTGAGRQRTERLMVGLNRGTGLVAITNFEAVQIGGFYELLLKLSPEIIVIDESHRIKDSGSMRAKRIYPLAHAADRRFILTGTPILNSMLDIYGQYKALSPHTFGPSFWKFRQKYFYDKNAGMPKGIHFPDWVAQPQAAKLISQVMSRTALHAKKSECLDLPPLVVVPVPVELSPRQKKAYLEMEKEFVAELDGVTSIAEFAMTKSLRLQQILAGFVSESAEKEAAWFEDCPRLQALKELLESLQGEQVVIWTNFTPTYKAIGNVCKDLKLTYTFLTGVQSTLEKEEALESFSAGRSRVLISNPAAGGTGVDGLQCAKYAIYYTRSYNAEHFWQSRDRIHRGGSEIHDKITQYHLVASDTVDETVLLALESKEEVAASLLKWARQRKQMSV
jgi:SNF2 family DNA or RNA helicase